MSFIDNVWYKKLGLKNLPVITALAPFTGLFYVISSLRRLAYSHNLLKKTRVKTPVIVVGGIAVGGTGKTPLSIALIEHLAFEGYKVGLLSRGYKGNAKQYPMTVQLTSKVEECGDEPLLVKLSLQDKVTVCVDPNRERGALHLEHLGMDVIVCDDGLQHYSLERDLEIIVIDGKRKLGNGFLMPSGPLREGAWRLKTATAVVVNGVSDNKDYESMTLVPDDVISLDCYAGNSKNHDYLQKQAKVIALAGIGNPQRFYNTLKECGYYIEENIDVPDHGVVSFDILKEKAELYPVVMTAKDAVKYARSGIKNLFVLNVKAVLAKSLYQKITDCLEDWNK